MPTIDPLLHKLYRPPAPKPRQAVVQRLESARALDLPGVPPSAVAILDRAFPHADRQTIRRRVVGALDRYLSWRDGCERLTPCSGGCSEACSCSSSPSAAGACRPTLSTVASRSEIPDGAPELSRPCVLLGYASATGLAYQYAGQIEQMRPGSFRDYLGAGWRIEARYAHAAVDVLGDSESGLLHLAEDSFGLLVALAVDGRKARQVAHLVRYGGATAMSWGRCNDGTQDAYRLGQHIAEHKRGRASEVSFVEKAANPATCAIAVCQGDLLGADPWGEQRFLAEERRLEWQAPSWAMGALQQCRRQRGLLRLQRLGAALLANNVFLSSRRQRGEIIAAVMSRM
ncbi:MAG TPA: HK97 family phage prohead protease [Pirellulales bacterium]|nr:HK97 family phage prohead protease [Pirellulales bacterium]